MSNTGHNRRAGLAHDSRPAGLLNQPPVGPARGMTRFMTIILLKGSGTYLFSSQCPRPVHAIPDSGARSPAVQRRAWVRLVVALFGGAGKGAGRFDDGLGPGRLSPQSCFSKCRISRMIGVIQQIVEHSGYSNV